jgi:hypothetical protein
VRRLAVLKTWVDIHGITTGQHIWAPQPAARPLDVDRWLHPRTRRDFDDENIGLLTAPPPDLDELGRDLSHRYSWLADLDTNEREIADGGAERRGLVLRLLGELPGARLRGLVR